MDWNERRIVSISNDCWNEDTEEELKGSGRKGDIR